MKEKENERKTREENFTFSTKTSKKKTKKNFNSFTLYYNVECEKRRDGNVESLSGTGRNKFPSLKLIFHLEIAEGFHLKPLVKKDKKTFLKI